LRPNHDDDGNDDRSHDDGYGRSDHDGYVDGSVHRHVDGYVDGDNVFDDFSVIVIRN